MVIHSSECLVLLRVVLKPELGGISVNAVRASSNSISGSSAGGWPQNVLPTSQAMPESCIRGIYLVLVNKYFLVSHLICVCCPGWGVLLYVITSPTGIYDSHYYGRDKETGDKGSILQIKLLLVLYAVTPLVMDLLKLTVAI